MRTETVVPALLFLAIAHTQTSLSGGAISPWLIGYVLALEIWFALLSPHLHGAAGVLTPARRIGLMSAVALAWPALTLLRRAPFAWLRAHLPALLLGAAILAVLAALRLDPEKMSRSGAALLAHMREPSWGGIWYALVLLWLLALRLPRLPLHQLFRTGPATYLLLIYLLAFVRVNPYRLGWGDSGNRMLTHVVAIGFFGLLLFYGRRRIATVRGAA